jgi:hypothetical protein
MADLESKIKDFEDTVNKTIMDFTRSLDESAKLNLDKLPKINKLKDTLNANFKAFKETTEFINNHMLANDAMLKKANSDLNKILTKLKETGRVSNKEINGIYDFYKNEVISNSFLNKINSINTDLKARKEKLYNSAKLINSQLTKNDMDLLFPFEALGHTSKGILKILTDNKSLNSLKSQLKSFSNDSNSFLKYFATIQSQLFNELGNYGNISGKFGKKINIGNILDKAFSNILNPAEFDKYLKGNVNIRKNVREFLVTSLSKADLSSVGSTQSFAKNFTQSLLKILGFDSKNINATSKIINENINALGGAKYTPNKPNKGVPSSIFNPRFSLINASLEAYKQGLIKEQNILDEKRNYVNLAYIAAAFDILRTQFPTLIRFIEKISVFSRVMYGALDNLFSGLFTRISRRIEIWASEEKNTNMIASFSKLSGGILGVAAASVGAATLIYGAMKYILHGVEKFEKAYISSASENKLNLLPFKADSIITQSPSLLERFAIGGGEEKLISANAAYLSRMGGNRVTGFQSPTDNKNSAFFSNFSGTSIQQIAALKDIITNVQGLNFNVTMFKEFNKSGILFNKVIGDMTENLDIFILYGKNSFENLSLLSNKLNISIKSASGLIEKFSTVSSAVETSYKLSLVTGKFINPLAQFSQYAYGSPDKILKNVLDMFGGSFANMNRLQQKYLADATGMSIQELATASQRLKLVQQIGESAYRQQYKSLDDIINSFGFQRLLGGLSQIMKIIEDKLMNTYFQKALDWIIANADKLPKMIDDFVSTVRNVVIPVMLKAVFMLGDALIFIANHIYTIIGAYLGAMVGSIFPGAGTAIGLVAGGLLGAGGDAMKGSIPTKQWDALKNKLTTNIDNINDGYITSRGSVVKTSPVDMAVFAKTNEGLLQNTISMIRSNGGSTNSIVNQYSGNSVDNIKIISVKSDVKLDGIKIGESLTKLAMSYG